MGLTHLEFKLSNEPFYLKHLFLQVLNRRRNHATVPLIVIVT